jgi:hypothetical protein
MIWSMVIAKILTTVMSWLDAGNLRNRVYKMAEEAEILMTALEDIERMDHGGKISQYARRAIDTVKGLPNEDNR